MTNHGDFSPEARQHAERTMQVSAVFAENADFLVEKLEDVPDGHVLIAVVNAEDEITGLHHVEQTDLVLRVPELEQTGGRSMVFSPGSSAEDIRRRTDDLAATAKRRAELIDRIAARRSE